MNQQSEKLRLVCGICNTINQFPAAKLDDQPQCAQCKEKLFSGRPIATGTAGLNRHIEHSGLPVLVDFWAPWCGPCVNFAPIFEAFAQQAGNQMRCLKVDTQANQQAALNFNIRSIPTLALFREGHEIARFSGALQLTQLQQWVVQQLNETIH